MKFDFLLEATPKNKKAFPEVFASVMAQKMIHGRKAHSNRIAFYRFYKFAFIIPHASLKRARVASNVQL